MKSIFLTFWAILLCTGVTLAREERTATREMNLKGSYTALEVSNMIHVVFEDRAEGSVRIEAPQELIDNVTVEVQRGKLVISRNHDKEYRKRHEQEGDEVSVYLPYGKVNSLSASGMSSFDSDLPWKGQALKLTLTGMSKCGLAIECKTLEIKATGMVKVTGSIRCLGQATIDLSGMSKFNVEGSTGTLQLKCSGMSKFHGENFRASDPSTCTVSGMSHADVWVDGNFEGSVSGMSTLTYNEGAKLQKMNITGNSSMRSR